MKRLNLKKETIRNLNSDHGKEAAASTSSFTNNASTSSTGSW